MTRTATCCCGQLRIEVTGDPAVNAICHCNNCQHRTVSAFGYSAYFDNEQIGAVTGQSLIYKIDSETQQDRHLCPTCGTTLYWSNSYFEGKTGIAGGCFTESPLP